jgi:hypothetical protein
MTPVQQQWSGKLPAQPPPGLSPKAWQLLQQHVVANLTYEEIARYQGVLPEDAQKMVEAASARLLQLS